MITLNLRRGIRGRDDQACRRIDLPQARILDRQLPGALPQSTSSDGEKTTAGGVWGSEGDLPRRAPRLSSWVGWDAGDG
jgi:hypothetical protein